VAQFFGQSPDWYKLILLVFLVVNPLVFYREPVCCRVAAGREFIFTLAMALKCYPLLPGGLLALKRCDRHDQPSMSKQSWHQILKCCCC
jgi:Na+/H+ antiporter NhaB